MFMNLIEHDEYNKKQIVHQLKSFGATIHVPYISSLFHILCNLQTKSHNPPLHQSNDQIPQQSFGSLTLLLRAKVSISYLSQSCVYSFYRI
jgi:hypothetical protein